MYLQHVNHESIYKHIFFPLQVIVATCFANSCSGAAIYSVEYLGSTGELGPPNAGQIADTNTGVLLSHLNKKNCTNCNKEKPESGRPLFKDSKEV